MTNNPLESIMTNPPTTPTTAPSTPAVTRQIWKLSNEVIQKCANHPDTVDHIYILSSYLEDVKEIATQAFKSGEIDEKISNLIIEVESDWVAMRVNTILVEEVQDIVKIAERLEREMEKEATEKKWVVENVNVKITNPTSQ